MEKILTGNRAESFIKAYKNSTHYTIFDAYKTYSKEKEKAYLNCLAEKLENDGILFKIVSHNTRKFTAGYLTINIIQGQTDYNLHIITKENRYVMEYK